MSFTDQLSDKKFEIAMFGMAALLLGGLSSLFKAPATQRATEQDVVYEMPRPKNFVSAGFDLNGREIDRNYINPFAKKAKAVGPVKAEVKAAQAKAAAVAKKKTAAQKAKDQNKAKVSVTVVNDKPSGSSLSADNSSGGGFYGGVSSVTAAKAAAGEANTADDKNKTSPDQWRALLSAQPTSANLAKLIAALLKGDVDQKTYNTIVSDLLSSSKADVQALGMDAANYSYSVATFSLVANKMDRLTGETKTQAQAYLMSYTSGSRLGLLASALRSSDGETVITATEIILQGYAQAKANTGSTGTRPGRGEVQTSSTANYTQFVTIFKTLAQSSDTSIASMAQTALGQIQTTVASL